MESWISIPRNITNWEWYKKSEMVHLLMHLIIKANHLPGNWQGFFIDRGQLITGRKVLSAETGISEQVIRTCLNRLVKSKKIQIKSTKNFSNITICNYDTYQFKNKQTNQQDNHVLTMQQPSVNHQSTTNNKYKKNKNEQKEKEYSSEIIDFYDGIIDFFPESTRPKNKSDKCKWFETIEILQKTENYSLPEIKKIIQHFRADEFWTGIFLSLPKLLSKNKDGVQYIDVFAEKIKNLKPTLEIKKDRMQNIMQSSNRMDL